MVRRVARERLHATLEDLCDLPPDEAVPRRSARLFVFDEADSGAESKSENSSEASKGSLDSESKPLDSIGCVFESRLISGKVIGEMTADGARLDIGGRWG